MNRPKIGEIVRVMCKDLSNGFEFGEKGIVVADYPDARCLAVKRKKDDMSYFVSDGQWVYPA